MKRRTIFDMTDEDRKAVIAWLNRETSYREMAEILGCSHENVRNHLAALIRQMFEDQIILIPQPPTK